MLVKTTVRSISFCLLLISTFGNSVVVESREPDSHNSHMALKTKANKQVTKVHMIATDSSLMAFPARVAAGKVEFIVSNQGENPHEMVVLKITQRINRLPLKGIRLDEAKAGTKIGEIESSELMSGATHKLMTTLTPGRYLLVSNVPGDYQAGMKMLLTVR